MTNKRMSYKLQANGSIQWLRTGTGFYQWNSRSKPSFAIDLSVLSKIVANTQLVGRRLRINYNHWPLTEGGPQRSPDDYERAGLVDPSTLRVVQYKDPKEGMLYGVFSPVQWDARGRERVINKTLTDFSPEICWDYVTEMDHRLPDGRILPAKSSIGPIFTGGALCDIGFFQMAEVQAFTRRLRNSFYKGVNMLTAAQLQELINLLMEAGWPDDLITAVVNCLHSSQSIADPATPPMPEVAADPLDPQTMVARQRYIRALGYRNPGAAAALPPRGPALTAPVAARPTAQQPLTPDLVRSIFQNVMQQPAPAAPVAPVVSPESVRLDRMEQMIQSMAFQQADRAGFHQGLPTALAQRLFNEAPSIYADHIASVVPTAQQLRSEAAPAGSRLQQVADLNNSTQLDKDTALITAYRKEQIGLKRNITTTQAIAELQAAGRIR